jgi:CheY-like chemotaxis protein
MSHDIRTPLNSILGMAAISQEHIDDKERVKDCMDKIDYAGRHLLDIINNVLDLSAIESGKMSLNPVNFNLKKFIGEMMNIVQPLADKRGHTLVTEIGDIHESVTGDKTKLRQLLMNILSNSVKYTPNGGKIVFRAEELEPDRQDVCRYLFTVEDNGIGMPQEFIDKIFEPFSRADSQRTSNVQGTGLGMAIAKNIALMMNGNIRVASEVNKGTRFEIIVCLKRAENPNERYIGEINLAETEKVRMSDFDFGGKRVLLAEDLAFNAEIAAEFLTEAGLVVDHATDGEKAVEMFEKSPVGYYDLIFMDIQMPKLDGYAAAIKIRGMDRADAASVPIIAMTANAFMDDIQHSYDSGMNGHIAKPIEIPRLAQTLVKIFGDKRKAT